jgi:hypothetical protein
VVGLVSGALACGDQAEHSLDERRPCEQLYAALLGVREDFLPLRRPQRLDHEHALNRAVADERPRTESVAGSEMNYRSGQSFQ